MNLPVTERSLSVFLSYASQDAEGAQKLCAALRAVDIEVFLDQSELRGGDVWDQKLRHEINDCALFIPIISANTASRHEGYFRLEWDLADQRTHRMGSQPGFHRAGLSGQHPRGRRRCSGVVCEVQPPAPAAFTPPPHSIAVCRS